MVRVNFRKNDGIEEGQIFKFFKGLGYKHVESNSETINVEDEIIPTEEFVRDTEAGRYYLNLAFGYKYSGNEKYPQINVFSRFGNKKLSTRREKRYTNPEDKRDIEEMYRIGRKLKEEELGFLEEKDQKCAHGTLHMLYYYSLMEYIDMNHYKKYDKGKYRKEFERIDSQCSLSLFREYEFFHVVCVYADVKVYWYRLVKSSAESILNQIIRYVIEKSILEL